MIGEVEDLRKWNVEMQGEMDLLKRQVREKMQERVRVEGVLVKKVMELKGALDEVVEVLDWVGRYTRCACGGSKGKHEVGCRAVKAVERGREALRG